MECEFCGYEFPEELGRYGCPNCEGDGPANPARHGRHQGRAESGGIEGRPDAAERGGAVADTENIGHTIRPHIEQQRPAGEQGPDDDIRREPVGLFATVADASSQRQQRPELGTAYSGNRGGAGNTWIS